MISKSASVVKWLSTQHAPMLELLEDLVNIDSGSRHSAGVDAVGRRLETFLVSHGVPVVWHDEKKEAACFSAVVTGQQPNSPPIILMGHRDTVFPQGEAEMRPFRIEADRAYGPGVADMKAGLVMNAFVAVAYHRHGGLSCPVMALFTTDEEIGSPRSRPIIANITKTARSVFNAEPARPSGNVVTGRKGAAFLKLTVQGKPAHSGSSFYDGISAINELAQKIVALKEITDPEKGVTLNVGLVSGGQSTNTVAPTAEAFIDLRYKDKHGRDSALKNINAIVNRRFEKGSFSTLSVEGEFDAFVPSPKSTQLFKIYQASMAELGIHVDGEFSGGCSDAGITSQLGCPTLCAVGPVGGFVHTPDEYLDYLTMVPRAQGLAMSIEQAASTF